MDVRDIFWWAKQAKRRAWERRVEAFNVALLPYQKRDAIEAAQRSLRAEGLEFAYGEKAADVEKENARLMAETEERRHAADRPRRKAKTRKRHSKIRRLR